MHTQTHTLYAFTHAHTHTHAYKYTHHTLFMCVGNIVNVHQYVITLFGLRRVFTNVTLIYQKTLK